MANDIKDRVEALEYDFQVIGDKLDDLKGQVEALPRAILSQTRKMRAYYTCRTQVGVLTMPVGVPHE